jgi:hypothetical protein
MLKYPIVALVHTRRSEEPHAPEVRRGAAEPETARGLGRKL